MWSRFAAAAALAGGTALAAAVFNGDMTSVPTSATQQADSWYVDRYAPGVFDSYSYGGGTVLRHGLRIADGAANRPGAFSSSFYNTQGRKYDLNLTGPIQVIQIEQHLPAAWATEDRSAGLWATGFDSNGDVSAYPIIAFRHSGNSSLWGGASVPAAYYGWQTQGSGGYNFSAAPSGYDTTHTLTIVQRVGVGTLYFVDGVKLASITDTDTTSLGNVILNATNFGDEDYDVYWDNLKWGGPAAFEGTTDTDGDGVSDWREQYVYLTNSSLRDTDSDGVWDGVEIAVGTDPLVAGATPTDTDKDGIPDASDDFPNSGDSDNDGIADGWEFSVNGGESLTGTPPMGDLNNSGGRPNSTDAKTLAKVVGGTASNPGMNVADVNQDGVVDGKDTTLLTNFAKGLIPFLPYR